MLVKYLLVGLLLVFILFALRRRVVAAKLPEQLWNGMIGLTGTAEQAFTTEGTITVQGEIWKATSRKGIIQKGERVRIVSVGDGLILEVEAV